MRHLLILITATALLAITAGCATTPAQRTEKLLGQSGFKAVPATTAAQQQQVTTLPAATISRVQRKGQTYYVYPDPARNVLYIGNQAQYEAYRTAERGRYLAQDAKLLRDDSAPSNLTEGLRGPSGAVPNWEQMWNGWPE